MSGDAQITQTTTADVPECSQKCSQTTKVKVKAHQMRIKYATQAKVSKTTWSIKVHCIQLQATQKF